MTPLLLVSLLTSCGGLAPSSSSSSKDSSSKEESTSSAVSSSSKEEESSKEERSSEEVSSREKSSHEELEPEITKKKVKGKLENHFSGEETYEEEAYYDDSWFLSSSKEENPGLALFSSMMGGVAATVPSDRVGLRAKAVLEEVGYHDVELNTYYEKGIMLEDSFGVMVGRKKIKDSSNKVYTLLSILPRSAGYGAEWYGDFEAGVKGLHCRMD